MIVLDSNSYYNLDYSLIPENKIKSITGTLKDNLFNKEVTETTQATEAKALQKVNGQNNVTVNLKDLNFKVFSENDTSNDEAYVYKQFSAYFGAQPGSIYLTNGGGRIEYAKGEYKLTVKNDTPFGISNVIITLRGDNLKYTTNVEEEKDTSKDEEYETNSLVRPMLSKINMRDDKLRLGFVKSFTPDDIIAMLDDKILVYNTFSNSINKFSLRYEDYMIEGMYPLDKAVPGTFTSIESITDDFDTATRRITKRSDYEYDIDISIPYIFNYAFYQEGNNLPIQTTIHKHKILEILSLNIVREISIEVITTQPNGSNIDFEFSLPVADAYKYKTSITGSNELVTNVTWTDGGIRWDKAISDILLEKFKDGKFWISAKVKNSFVLNNKLGINSKMQIKDVDNEFINRKGTTLTFEIKNMELIYQESQCYYNLTLMEV